MFKNEIQIAICDDEKLFAEDLETMLAELLIRRKLKYEIRRFLSGEALLKEIDYLDAVFLDIEMPGMDGIATGRRIRDIAPNCVIVVVTSMENRYKEAFPLRAVSFVTKPVQRGELDRALDEVLRDFCGGEELELYWKNTAYQVRQRDIAYIRTYNGYTEFVIDGKRFRREESLNQVIKWLDERIFARIHRQYVVNLGKIQKRKSDSVVVETEELPLARRLKKEFEEKYIEYDLNYR